VKKICANILEAIGGTPMVRINRLTKGVVKGTVLAKIETFNPGNSIKDRMAVTMIEDAERAGLLKPGGTIIEGTSGNTGMGPRHRRRRQGLQVHLHDDRQAVEGESRRAQGLRRRRHRLPHERRSRRIRGSYYSVSSRLEREVPNSWKANQYDNLSNSKAHYEQTAPEIWEQTGGRSRTWSPGSGPAARSRASGAT
jgi:cystathionine beta-synthase